MGGVWVGLRWVAGGWDLDGWRVGIVIEERLHSRKHGGYRGCVNGNTGKACNFYKERSKTLFLLTNMSERLSII